MRTINEVILFGRLIKDPEFKATSNSSLAVLVISVNDPFRKKKPEDRYEPSCLIRVTTWGSNAVFVNTYARKNDNIMIRGYLNINSWVAPDGSKRSELRVTANDINLIASSRGDENQFPKCEPDPAFDANDGNDVPF